MKRGDFVIEYCEEVKAKFKFRSESKKINNESWRCHEQKAISGDAKNYLFEIFITEDFSSASSLFF